MASINCFEKYASDYEEWFDKNSKIYNGELKELKRLIGDAQNGVDIGCGSGRFFVRPNIIVGVEPSAQMRQIALSKGCSVVEGVAEKLLFDDKTFDFAQMMTTICFVSDAQKSIQEAFRVLKCGGFFIVGFIDKNSELGKRYEKSKDASRFYASARFYSVDEVAGLCINAGFDGFEKHGNSDNTPLTLLKFSKK